MLKKIIVAGVCVLANLAYADGMQSLDSFLRNNTIAADFTQTVYGNKKNKVSQGNMQIERPNKFRWQYTDGQLIVGDGKNLYIYDQDLQQVTQRRFNNSLGKSPAILLAGGTDIKKYYNVTPLPESGGLEWVSLMPKNINDNNGFKSVIMGFTKDSKLLSQMKFTDTFDNKSMINFANVKTGMAIAPATFSFTPPPGVDVIKPDSN